MLEYNSINKYFFYCFAIIILTNNLSSKNQEVYRRGIVDSYNNTQEVDINAEYDSLYKAGNFYKKIRKQNLFSIHGLLSNSEYHKNILNSSKDVEYRGVNLGFVEKTTFKNLAPDYNLLKLEYYEFGFNLLSAETTTEIEEFGNITTATNSLYHVDLNLGIGRGYGWAIKTDQAFSISNSTGITNGLILKSFDNSFNLADEETDPVGISRDYFSSNMSYQVNKTFHINLGITRFNTYEDFKLFEGISSKIIETGIFYAIDEYVIDYMAKSKVEFIPIYNVIIQNGISYLIYNMKKDNDLFPLKGGKGTLNTQFQVGVTYKF